jgi:hypothetical protein
VRRPRESGIEAAPDVARQIRKAMEDPEFLVEIQKDIDKARE